MHVGAHGTLEWLPGKAVALTAACFPEAVVGPLPVIYPFIVSNPGEAAQAKRRIAAVTIGHLPPPLVGAGLDRGARSSERLVDEYAQADGLDRRRRERLARLIVETRARSGLPREAGVDGGQAPDEALRRIDAWLCDLKDLAVKDGLHIYGRAPAARADPPRRRAPRPSAMRLIAALDGRRVAPGPSGAPARGRRDVLPTGRNLFTADPRTLPTPTAMDLGRVAADEVMRRYMQDHGEMPRALVIDLWGSATLRTGGEEIAQGLALMGCRAALGPGDRPRHRHRGAAVRRGRPPARRRHLAHLRPVPRSVPGADRAARRRRPAPSPRATRLATKIRWPPSGSRHGSAAAAHLRHRARRLWRRHGGPCSLPATGRRATSSAPPIWPRASHAYGGADGEGAAAPGAFAGRVAEADLLVHAGDDPGRDLLEGAEDVAFVGGFAAAAAALGRKPDLVMLDTTDPARPARPLAGRGAGADRARARRQPALHRRPDAPRAARRRGARRDRRPADRLRGDDRRGAERADRSRSRRLSRRPDGCAPSCCARTPAARAPSPSGSRRRAGAACGIRAATTSTTSSRR